MTKSPPLCHYCGGPIRKCTTLHWFGENMEFYKDHRDRASHHGEKPRSREEAQRHVNQQIVAHEWSRTYKDGDLLPRDQQFIRKVHLWDGESYQDEFFCNGDHAKRFAYLLASEGRCTNEYNKAIAKRNREKEGTPCTSQQ